jgi:hypothetical protein
VLGRTAVAACLVLLAWPATAGAEDTIQVESQPEFQAAVEKLRATGGRIDLLPHPYFRRLLVSGRFGGPLRIVGRDGARVQRLLLYRTRGVSVGPLRLAPLTGDARIRVRSSRNVVLHDLFVSAEGTRWSAGVEVPDSDWVSIRRSTFTHCGDRSPNWSNCVLVRNLSNHVTIAHSWFHDCYGCDFVHGRFGFDLELRRNRFERALPCSIGRRRCGHQDLVELFAGRGLVVEDNRFGVYRVGGAQLYLTNAIDHVRIVNNVFLGTDPRVPGYQSRVGLIVGSRATVRVPHFVQIVNNTILTGARRVDGYLGSIRMSTQYAALPLRMRPVLANNVIGRLENPHHLCDEVQASVANVVLDGTACSASDQVGSANLDVRGRPTSESAMVIDAGSRRYAPKVDIRGRSRRSAPDIGAFEYGR